MKTHFGASALCLGLVVAGCGDRPDSYDAPVGTVQAFGLEDEVAIVDDGAHRVLLLVPQDDQRLDRVSLPVGKGVIRAEASKDVSHGQPPARIANRCRCRR